MKLGGVNRSQHCTLRYGEDRGGRRGVRNHDPARARPLRKLLELLCDAGERSGGRACETCESRCGFGREWLARMMTERNGG